MTHRNATLSTKALSTHTQHTRAFNAPRRCATQVLIYQRSRLAALIHASLAPGSDAGAAPVLEQRIGILLARCSRRGIRCFDSEQPEFRWQAYGFARSTDALGLLLRDQAGRWHFAQAAWFHLLPLICAESIQ